MAANDFDPARKYQEQEEVFVGSIHPNGSIDVLMLL